MKERKLRFVVDHSVFGPVKINTEKPLRNSIAIVSFPLWSETFHSEWAAVYQPSHRSVYTSLERLLKGPGVE